MPPLRPLAFGGLPARWTFGAGRPFAGLKAPALPAPLPAFGPRAPDSALPLLPGTPPFPASDRPPFAAFSGAFLFAAFAGAPPFPLRGTLASSSRFLGRMGRMRHFSSQPMRS